MEPPRIVTLPASHMEHDVSFGRWLTLRRQAAHVQRTELAARIGCAVVTLQKI
jgi:hypothetical protein